MHAYHNILSIQWKVHTPSVQVEYKLSIGINRDCCVQEMHRSSMGEIRLSEATGDVHESPIIYTLCIKNLK